MRYRSVHVLSSRLEVRPTSGYAGSLGTVRCEKVALQWQSSHPYELSVDFSAIGVTNGTVAFFKGGGYQGSVPVNFFNWKGLLNAGGITISNAIETTVSNF